MYILEKQLGAAALFLVFGPYRVRAGVSGRVRISFRVRGPVGIRDWFASRLYVTLTRTCFLVHIPDTQVFLVVIVSATLAPMRLLFPGFTVTLISLWFIGT